jgi:hypothetical protein
MHLAEDKVDWVAGFEDECWWSRVRQPNLHSFGEEGEPLRLVEQSVEKDDPDPKAISCYVYARAQRGVAAFCGWAPGERHNYALSFVVLREA